ncbi:acyl-CoA carboxylase subunit beta [Phytohabitans flavus]
MTTVVQPIVDTDPRSPAARLHALLDPQSMEPFGPDDGTEVRSACGLVDGNPVLAYCTDATQRGGALGATGAQRIIDTIQAAVRQRCPVIGIWHSGGAKLADGVESMDGVGRMFAAMTHASGLVPQISVVLGPAAGAAAYGPALTDIVVMSEAGRMFVTGPDVVRSVTGESVDMESLGGLRVHSRNSGVVHVPAKDDAEAFARARQLTSLLTAQGRVEMSLLDGGVDLGSFLPPESKRAYDVRPLVRGLVDAEPNFVELQPKWATNMVVGFGRLAGRTVGVLANNPLRKGGCLDSLSAEKASRFVRMCNSFGVPMVVIVDVPGYLPGARQEWEGVIRRGAKLLHAFAEAVVPRVTLVTRKSYGGAYIAMNSRSLGATAVFAWPQAEVAVMAAEAAAGVLYRKRLAAAPEEERAQLLAGFVAEVERESGGVTRALSLGVVDEVVAPGDSRRRIAQVLADAPASRGRRGNIPL